MNSQIDEERNNTFFLYNVLKTNIEYQADFSLENSLQRSNTKFLKNGRQQQTYTHLNKAEKGLGYVLINKHWIIRNFN